MVGPDGELRPGGAASPAAYAVVPLHIALRGEQGRRGARRSAPTGRASASGGSTAAPPRHDHVGPASRTATSTARRSLTAYDCRAGTFDAQLLVKEPQTVSVFLNGRLVQRKAFPSATTSHVVVPARAENAERTCKLRIVSDGLLGTTRFAFDRAQA